MFYQHDDRFLHLSQNMLHLKTYKKTLVVIDGHHHHTLSVIIIECPFG